MVPRAMIEGMDWSTSWSRLLAEAPALADTVRTRFAANRHHILGTVRTNGAPRLSGTEVDVTSDGIRIGMMDDAHKRVDIARDARVEIHSAPTDADLVEADVKVGGRLEHLGPVAEVGGDWFGLALTHVSAVRVDGDELVFDTWHHDTGARQRRRR